MNLILFGASGRMGSRLSALARDRGHQILPPDAARADAIIDFSHPDALPAVLACARRLGCPCLICTTGYTPDQLALIQAAAQTLPLRHLPNTSPAVAFLADTLREAARRFPQALIRITETHHANKKDAPSGTALLLREAAGRPVPIRSLRQGSVTGTHSVTLSLPLETLSLRHEALSPDLFCLGALEVVQEMAMGEGGGGTF